MSASKKESDNLRVAIVYCLENIDYRKDFVD
jgi:hypothetical protein